MKRTKSCEQVILSHLETHRNEWVKKVDLFTIAYEHGGFSPATTDPLLRRMERAGKIKMGKYDGQYTKNLVQYCIGEVQKKVSNIIIKDGVAYLK